MIFILTYVIIEFFDQSKIDQVISFVNQYHNEQYLSTSFCEHNNQVLSRGSFLLSGPAMGLNVLSDIIIGDTPAETLFINGYFYNAGNIIIINDGVLKMKNADFHLDGNISVLNHGKLYADSSVLRFLQDYIYQYGIGLYDSAQFYLTNSTTNYNGYPFGFSAMSFAKVEIENVVNHDWTTAMVNGRADVYLNNVDITGEWLFDGNCIARFNNVDNFLSWYFFPESSAVDFRFPEGTYVNGFFVDSTLNNVHGIGYH
ncbi:MAG: hypothetical protein ABIL20_08255, partial [candidate division WOR-3 bacterium]